MIITSVIIVLILKQKCFVYQVHNWKILDFNSKSRLQNRILFSKNQETKTEFKFKSKILSINSQSKEYNTSFKNCQSEHVKRFSSSSKHKIFSLANSSHKRFSGTISNKEEDSKDLAKFGKLGSNEKVDSCFTFMRPEFLNDENSGTNKRIDLIINMKESSNIK